MLRAVQSRVISFSIASAIAGTAGAATNGVLTTASEVISLPQDQAAREIPVVVTGTVTLAEPNWKGTFFVQDSTSGVFVTSTNPPPLPGDVVQVSGVSDPGNY